MAEHLTNDHGERPNVDLQTEMLLRMMSDLRLLVTEENIETRKQFNDGINRMLAEQKITNGRVNRLERDLASLDTRLEERTANMVCAEHAATFKHIEEHLDDLKALPQRVAVLERSPQEKPSRSTLSDGAAKIKLIGLTGTGIAGLAILGEAIWTWVTKR